MPVQVNPLLLQMLFYEMLNDLQYVQDELYNDELSRLMKVECMKKRSEYRRRLQELIG
jgi:hypothetical protein